MLWKSRCIGERFLRRAAGQLSRARIQDNQILISAYYEILNRGVLSQLLKRLVNFLSVPGLSPRPRVMVSVRVPSYAPSSLHCLTWMLLSAAAIAATNQIVGVSGEQSRHAIVHQILIRILAEPVGFLELPHFAESPISAEYPVPVDKQLTHTATFQFHTSSPAPNV
jgi:hypothetical protein